MVSGISSNVGFGFVTALPMEFAAACQMLEQQREVSLPRDPGQYVLGELPSSRQGTPHTAVLTVLPCDGSRSAAAACTSLLAGFPTIRAIIMIGIAGGVPAVEDPRRHVRLGDIVVANEIIDYGHLRSVDGQQVLRRRIDSPSVDLVGADRRLQAGEADGQRPWEAWLGAGADPVPRTFARPANDTDVVTAAGRPVAHPDDSAHGRRPGFPRVHRGIVASGDQLVRDAAERERLANRYSVCAIEMEGAGIAAATALRSVPWFMVRGIADYCDNATKNDLWHPYASLAAAAYVRALLAHCAANDTDVVTAAPVALRSAPARGVTARNVRTLATSTIRPSNPIQCLQLIVDAILDIQELLDNGSRRMLVSMLPRNIQTSIPEQSSARLQVISIVRTCAGFRDGQSALVGALRACIPSGSIALERAEAIVRDNWDGLIV